MFFYTKKSAAIFFLFIMSYSNYLSTAKLTSLEQSVLNKERTTNLIIINDIQEIIDPTNPFATSLLTQALDDQQLILCTKSVWINLQSNFTKLNTELFLNNEPFSIDSTYQQIQGTKWENILQEYVLSLEHIESSMISKLKQDFKNNFFINLNCELQNILNYILDLIHAHYKKLLATRNDFLQLIKSKYICKELNNDFILFIPQKYVQNQSKNLIKDAWTGLSYSQYPDYSLTNIIDQKRFEKISERSQFLLENMHIFNESLFQVITALIISNQFIKYEDLPFFNIFLIGHGSDNLIAEIDINPIKNEELSPFLKLMHIFNRSFRTKSVTLMSCYPGGKKLVDAYKIDNKYTNKFLDAVSYTIINIGTLYKTIRLDINQKFFINYFSDLQETPPNYSKICSMLTNNFIENHISLKLPHTAWFSPIQLKDHTITLSQVAMTTKNDPITIDSKKIIFLGANYIPRTLKFNADEIRELPIFLPENYINQSYYFTNLEFDNLTTDIDLYQLLWHMIYKDLFYESPVIESIIFAFEQIKIGAKTYKDIYCTYFIENNNNFTSSLLYTDPDGKTIQYSWPFAQLPNSLNQTQVTKKIINPSEAKNMLKNFKEKILKSLSPGLEKSFIQKLENTIKKVI